MLPNHYRAIHSEDSKDEESKEEAVLLPSIAKQRKYITQISDFRTSSILKKIIEKKINRKSYGLYEYTVFFSSVILLFRIIPAYKYCSIPTCILPDPSDSTSSPVRSSRCFPPEDTTCENDLFLMAALSILIIASIILSRKWVSSSPIQRAFEAPLLNVIVTNSKGKVKTLSSLGEACKELTSIKITAENGLSNRYGACIFFKGISNIQRKFGSPPVFTKVFSDPVKLRIAEFLGCEDIPDKLAQKEIKRKLKSHKTL